MELQNHQRRYLAKAAHSLKPIVYVGKAGIGPAVAKSLREALDHHELVKVKFVDHKGEKRDFTSELAAATGGSVVRIIGNIAIFYKTQADPDKRTYFLPAAK